jgi:hypothetical protein
MMVNGKAVAVVGDSCTCPLPYHGSPRIVEGSTSDLWHGKAIAYDGCALSCGCKVMTTIKDEWLIEPNRGGGGSSGGASRSSAAASQQSTKTSSTEALSPVTLLFNEKFQLVDEDTGEPLVSVEYAIVRKDGSVEYGKTDENGYTHLLSSTVESELVEIYV